MAVEYQTRYISLYSLYEFYVKNHSKSDMAQFHCVHDMHIPDVLHVCLLSMTYAKEANVETTDILSGFGAESSN